MISFTTRFELNPADRVDTAGIPTWTLHTGAKLPGVGIGTFGNTRNPPMAMAESVVGGLSVGYRFVDCAGVYGNEKEIGAAIATALAGGLRREDLFITSKLWNDKHQPKDVLPTLRQSMTDLGQEYLDSYYIHWPVRNTHPADVAWEDRFDDSTPYSHDRYMETYRELEKAVGMGLIRHIGTSNMSIGKLKAVLRDATIKPATNQLEMHPAFAQPELFAYLNENGIVPIAFCPLGSPGRPSRDTAPEDVHVMTHPVIVDIAKRRGEHPAAICIKWAIQRGQLPIPSSIRRENYRANLAAAANADLTQEEMTAVSSVDCDCRLIKGQVLLWPGANSWRDLWD